MPAGRVLCRNDQGITCKKATAAAIAPNPSSAAEVNVNIFSAPPRPPLLTCFADMEAIAVPAHRPTNAKHTDRVVKTTAAFPAAPARRRLAPALNPGDARKSIAP